jgi:hypothetical protein
VLVGRHRARRCNKHVKYFSRVPSRPARRYRYGCQLTIGVMISNLIAEGQFNRAKCKWSSLPEMAHTDADPAWRVRMCFDS